MAFLSPDLVEWTVGLNEQTSPFCSLLQQRLHLLDRCLASDREHAVAAAQSGHLVTYVCHAGLAEAVIPVYVGTLLIGYVIIGQVRTTRQLPASICMAWRDRFGSLTEIKEAFHALTYYPPDRLHNMLNLFELTVQYMVSQKLIAIDLNLLVDTVIGYIAQHIGRNIAVEELETVTGKSASTVARAFRYTLGRSVKQVMIEMKLEAAEAYFCEHPTATITETAAAVGFTDPFYFSRLYKKHRHISPSARWRATAGTEQNSELNS
jgi:AraC-like DNA-binding protein